MATMVTMDNKESDEWIDPRLQSTRDYQLLIAYIDQLTSRRDRLHREIDSICTSDSCEEEKGEPSLPSSPSPLKPSSSSGSMIKNGRQRKRNKMGESGALTIGILEPAIDYGFYERFVNSAATASGEERGKGAGKRKRISSSKRKDDALLEMMQDPDLRESDEFRELQRLLRIKRRKRQKQATASAVPQEKQKEKERDSS